MRPGQRLVLLWDRATYHHSKEFREYLSKVYQDLPPEKWLITCIPYYRDKTFTVWSLDKKEK